MAEATLKIPALRGKVTITNEHGDGDDYIASAKGWNPYRVKADNLGEAVNSVIMNIHLFSRSSDYNAKRAIAMRNRADAKKAMESSSATLPTITLPSTPENRRTSRSSTQNSAPVAETVKS
jgi:hypothetical protein